MRVCKMISYAYMIVIIVSNQHAKGWLHVCDYTPSIPPYASFPTSQAMFATCEFSPHFLW